MRVLKTANPKKCHRHNIKIRLLNSLGAMKITTSPPVKKAPAQKDSAQRLVNQTAIIN